LIGRKLKRDEKFETSFAKVKSKESEKNLQRLSKRTEATTATEKLSHLKTALGGLEEKKIRDARTRSTSRATVLEIEVEELRKESDRLDEENVSLRSMLDKVKTTLPPPDREKVEKVLKSFEAPPNASKDGIDASRRAVMASPGRAAWRNDEAAAAVSVGSGSPTVASYAAPPVLVHSVPHGPFATGISGMDSGSGPAVPAARMQAWGPTVPAGRAATPSLVVTPLRGPSLPPAAAASLNEAPLTAGASLTSPNATQPAALFWCATNRALGLDFCQRCGFCHCCSYCT